MQPEHSAWQSLMRIFAGYGAAICLVLLGGSLLIDRLDTDTSLPGTVPSLSHQQFVQAQNDLSKLLAGPGGLASAFAYSRQRMAHEPSFARDCHPLMHYLGYSAFAYYGSFAKAADLRDELCNSGYIHGLIEASISRAPDIRQAVLQACPVNTSQQLRQWQCYHGIGHGAMLASDKKVDPALALCRLLPSDFAISSCANGVYMEHFIVVDHSGQLVQNAHVSLDECSQAPTAYRVACYYYAPSGYLALHASNYSAAYDWCSQTTPNYIATCVSGVGGQAMKDNIATPSFVADLCSSFDQRYRTTCASGAISIYINIQASSVAAEKLCTAQFRDFASICHQTVQSNHETFGV
jgi:hypothetical protein